MGSEMCIRDRYIFMWEQEQQVEDAADLEKVAGSIMVDELDPAAAEAAHLLGPADITGKRKANDRTVIEAVIGSDLPKWKEIFTENFKSYYRLCAQQNQNTLSMEHVPVYLSLIHI